VQHDDLDLAPPSPRRAVLTWSLVALGGVLAFGLITWLLGVGPFAWRVLAFDSTELYVLNMGKEPVEVTLDGGTPFEVAPEDARRRPIYGGTTHVVTRTKDGALIEEIEVTADGAPAVYNVQGTACLALADVSSFFLKVPPANKGVKVLKTFPQGERVVNLPNPRVIWPRKTLMDQVFDADKGVAWVEIVACPLLDPQEVNVLEAHLNVLLTERKKKQQEDEIKREMMRKGGSEAVDQRFADVGAAPAGRPTPDAGGPAPEAPAPAPAAEPDASSPTPAEPDAP